MKDNRTIKGMKGMKIIIGEKFSTTLMLGIIHGGTMNRWDIFRQKGAVTGIVYDENGCVWMPSANTVVAFFPVLIRDLICNMA